MYGPRLLRHEGENGRSATNETPASGPFDAHNDETNTAMGRHRLRRRRDPRPPLRRRCWFESLVQDALERAHPQRPRDRATAASDSSPRVGRRARARSTACEGPSGTRRARPSSGSPSSGRARCLPRWRPPTALTDPAPATPGWRRARRRPRPRPRPATPPPSAPRGVLSGACAACRACSARAAGPAPAPPPPTRPRPRATPPPTPTTADGSTRGVHGGGTVARRAPRGEVGPRPTRRTGDGRQGRVADALRVGEPRTPPRRRVASHGPALFDHFLIVGLPERGRQQRRGVRARRKAAPWRVPKPGRPSPKRTQRSRRGNLPDRGALLVPARPSLSDRRHPVVLLPARRGAETARADAVDERDERHRVRARTPARRR